MNPACWSWDVPLVYAPTEASIREWQDGRCATCGGQDPRLVLDHDHETAMIRGFLCRSCNVTEGRSDGELWLRYRQRNPATMLGVQEVFWSVVTGYAKPEPVWDEDDPDYRVRTRAAVDAAATLGK